MSENGTNIARPLAITLHGSIPSEAENLDYLSRGQVTNNNKYLFIVKVDLTGYSWLALTHRADSHSSAMTLVGWNRTFTVPFYLVSDQGSHFIWFLTRSPTLFPKL